ncbi:DUF2339 domain-containing protein [Natronomonas salina]|uniref:DUF2339 domain-containing protein n=1 Tax=Natronomonas salina TaxID=1710540 RepID=UPI0015B3E5C7|nr:DUF2339 domain-containing protein [Natronomonas salina]QLD90247.1 DUF2339 domain-containing protein [Natronomonas salina]
MSDDADLREAVRRLESEVDALHRRLDALEEATDREPTDRPSDPVASEAETGPSTDAPPPTDAEAARPTGPPGDESTATPESTAGGWTQVGDTQESGRDWELAVGVRWLGLLGALALVVGVVFFVRLAIERGMLGPLGRVAAGTVGGLALLAVGRYAATRRGYVRWGRIASGAGLAVAYFSIYAAYGFASYREAIGTPLWAALAAMTLLVGATAAVSIRDRAPLVAGEAFLFGYVTAYLSTEATTLVLTPTYALLLAGGLVAIAAVRSWSGLVVASVFATYAVVGFWLLDLDPPSWGVAVVTGATFLLYLAGSYALRRYDRFDDPLFRGGLVALTVSNGLFAALLLEISLLGLFAEPLVEGAGTVLVGLALAVFYALTDRPSVLHRHAGVPGRRDGTAAATSVVLLAVGLGQALGPFWTTVAGLAVVCLAVGLSAVDDAPAFRTGAHVVAVGVAGKILVFDAGDLAGFDAAEPLAALTGRPVAFALGVAVFYGLARWFAVREGSLHDAERSRKITVSAPYAAAATVIAVVGLGLELSGVGISVAWALFGVALLAVGLAGDRRGVRLLGVGVLGLATAKVFLFDTRGLDTVARTLSFLVLGAVLLAASYGYARTRADVDLGIDLPGGK